MMEGRAEEQHLLQYLAHIPPHLLSLTPSPAPHLQSLDVEQAHAPLLSP